MNLLFCLNLVFSYPLQLYPAHIIIENSLYTGWPKSRKRQWTKNFTRTLLVVGTVIFTMSISSRINKFIGLLGSFTCTPVAFTFPAAFHYKAVAETRGQKCLDLSIVILSIVAMFVTGIYGLISFND